VALWLESKINAISGVTLTEWVEIKATLAALEDDKFNCRKCLSRYEGRADGEKMLGKVRQNMACQEMKAEPIHKVGDELRFRTCVGNYVKPQVHAFVSAHRRFEQGVMPYSGGLMEQPGKIIEIFNIIDSHNAERMEREQAKADMIARRSGGHRV
jgi:hypothetical protein